MSPNFFRYLLSYICNIWLASFRLLAEETRSADSRPADRSVKLCDRINCRYRFLSTCRRYCSCIGSMADSSTNRFHIQPRLVVGTSPAMVAICWYSQCPNCAQTQSPVAKLKPEKPSLDVAPINLRLVLLIYNFQFSLFFLHIAGSAFPISHFHF